MRKHSEDSLCRLLSRCFSLATILLLSLYISPASAQGVGYWHTSGNKILDANNVEVRIAGINWYGFETPDHLAHGLWAQDYKTILNTIKSLGLNVVRIPFSNEVVESNPVPTNYTNYVGTSAVNQDLVGKTALQDLDLIVGYAGSIGLRVILDNHRSEAGESNESSGLWYTSAYPQSAWIADWQTMATRYSASQFSYDGNPTVIGMDLRNEPHLNGTTGSCWTGDTTVSGCPTTLTTQNWPVAATAAGNAILAINPDLLIFVEGNDCYSGSCGWQGGNLMGVANYPITLNVANHLVYSAHDYGPNLSGQSWFSSSTTTSSLNSAWNQFWGYISANNTAPVWLGEFGTDNTSSDIESSIAGSQGQWFETLISYLQNNAHIQWTYWALNGEDSYGLLDSNYDSTAASSLKESLLQTIQFQLSGSGTTSGFTLSPSSASLTVAQGASVTDTISVNDLGSFSGSVTLSASGLPTGVTAVFATNPATSSTTLTLSAAGSTAVGSYSVTVTGISGSLTASTTITLNVTAPASFTLSPSAASLSVTQGSTATDTITVVDSGSFSGSVTLSVSGLPSGVTAAYSVNPTTGSSVITFTASSAATVGTSTVTVTGTSGSLTASTNIALTVKTASTSGFACHVVYTISSQWASGFGAAISLKNSGTTAWSSWTLTWSFADGQTISQLWNGSESQTGASVTVQNLSYNGSIAAGSTYTGMGFNGTWNNSTNSVPASFAVNGNTCN